MSWLGRWRYRRLLQRRAHCTALPGLERPLPDPALSVQDAPLLALDLETTGLDANEGSIVSMGWAAVDDGRMRLSSCRHYLIGGADGVGPSAVIHGIRDCDRRLGGSLEQAMQALLQAAAGRVLVVHHAPMDMAFLQAASQQLWQQAWPVPVIDTLHWYRRRCQRRGHELKQGQLRLEAVRQAMGLPPRTGHDALADALSCGELLLALAAGSRARLVDVMRCWHSA